MDSNSYMELLIKHKLEFKPKSESSWPLQFLGLFLNKTVRFCLYVSSEQRMSTMKA
jgi:hypothetical protein